MSKVREKNVHSKTLREELVTTIVQQARVDREVLDELADDISDLLQDGDANRGNSIASQVLDMRIDDEEFKQHVIKKVLEEYKD